MTEPIYLGFPLFVACAASVAASIVIYQWFLYGMLKIMQNIGEIIVPIFPDTGEGFQVMMRNSGTWTQTRPVFDWLSVDDERTAEKLYGRTWYAFFKPEWYTTPLLCGIFVVAPNILIMIVGESAIGKPIAFHEASILSSLIIMPLLISVPMSFLLGRNMLGIFFARIAMTTLLGHAVLVNVSNFVSFITSTIPI